MPEREERGAEEGGVFDCVVVVEAVAIELWDRASSDDHAGGEAVFEDVEG